MTVAVPGRGQEIAKRTGQKAKMPVVLKARHLAGRVDAIWKDLDQGAKEFVAPYGARIIQHAKNAYNYLHVHCGKLLRDVRSMLAEVQWKVLADIPRALWKTNGNRIVSTAEQAAFNLMANLPENVIVPDLLMEKASKDIGESTVFIEGSAENQLTPLDIWTRLLRELDGLEGFYQTILELDGRKPTAIISSGLPNACAVLKLMNDYSTSAAGSTGFIRHIELADGGTLKLAFLARRVCTWHFGYEDLVLIALGPER